MLKVLPEIERGANGRIQEVVVGHEDDVGVGGVVPGLEVGAHAGPLVLRDEVLDVAYFLGGSAADSFATTAFGAGLFKHHPKLNH